MLVNSRKYCIVNSSVTHDIAKMDNISYIDGWVIIIMIDLCDAIGRCVCK